MPVGADNQRHADVRILASTNVDLRTKIAEGTFRNDLYFRLARFPIGVPPLRERREDIPLLVEHFLSLFSEKMGIERPALSDEAKRALETYHFPGNIRELMNVIEYVLIKSDGSTIQPEHLRFINSSDVATVPTTGIHSTVLNSMAITPEQSSALIIKGALAQTGGDVEAAARLLGISPTQIHPFMTEGKGNPMKNPKPHDSQTEEELILEYVRQNGSISNAECRNLLNVDRNRAFYLLNKMRAAGLLTCQGSRRWARNSLY